LRHCRQLPDLCSPRLSAVGLSAQHFRSAVAQRSLVGEYGDVSTVTHRNSSSRVGCKFCAVLNSQPVCFDFKISRPMKEVS
jgi:hypothetical protein